MARTKVNFIKVFEKMDSEVADAKREFDKFVGGNKSAGVRLRKHMQEVKKCAQVVREEVSVRSKTMSRNK